MLRIAPPFPAVLLATTALVVLAALPAVAVAPPLIRFDFDEGGGSVTTNSGTLGTAADGVISGATYSVDTPLDTGFSLQFDGDTDFVEVADVFDYGDEVTVQAWIRPDLLGGQRAIYDDYGNPGVFFAIYDDMIQFGVSTTGTPGLGLSVFAKQVCAGVWQHVAGTYDGTTIRAYVNGILVGTNATTGSIIDNSSVPTHIGADSAHPDLLEFKGRIDDLRVTAEALDPAEMGVEFPPAGGVCPPLPPVVDLDKDDGGHTWGEDPLIRYDITVGNPEQEALDVTLEETVPRYTTFVPGQSTAGWQCTPNDQAGSECTLQLDDLPPAAQSAVEFSVLVNEGTPQHWDVHNVVEAVSAPSEAAMPAPDGAVARALPRSHTYLERVRAAEYTVEFYCEDIEDFIERSYCCMARLYLAILRGELYQPAAAATHGESLVASSAGTQELLLYALRDEVFDDRRGGRRATQLFYEHSPAINEATFDGKGSVDPEMADLGIAALRSWLPFAAALVAGHGDRAVITQQQVDALLAWVDALRERADGDLAAAIDRERARLDVEGWAGLDMDEAFSRLDRLTCEGYEQALFCGELSGDCVITAGDALRALRMAVGQLPHDPAADMNNNGQVTAADALQVLRVAVGVQPPGNSCED